MKLAFYVSIILTVGMITLASYITNDLSIAAAILSSMLSLVLYISAFAIFVKPEDRTDILDDGPTTPSKDPWNWPGSFFGHHGNDPNNNLSTILIILSLLTLTSCDLSASLQTKCLGVDRKETIVNPTEREIREFYEQADSLTQYHGCDCILIYKGDTLYVSRNNSVGLIN